MIKNIDLSGLNIESYLSKKGIKTYQNVKNISPGWIGINCPFCGDDPSWHLGISKNNAISCFRCGIKGSALKLVMKIEKCSFKKALSIINEKKSHLKRPAPQEEVHSVSKVDSYNFTSELLPPHKRYLESRKFDSKYLFKKYELMSCYLTGKFKYRVIIPFYQREKILSFTSLDITGQAESKYENLSDNLSVVPIKNMLYNYDSSKEIAIIVEGPTDVWRIGEGCFGLLGKKATSMQKLMIGRIKKPFIMLDADAIKDSYELAYQVSGINPNVEVIEMSSGDPNDLPEDEVIHLRKQIFGKR